jgi:hypothetical protein
MIPPRKKVKYVFKLRKRKSDKINRIMGANNPK